jgi:hypothetical protein
MQCIIMVPEISPHRSTITFVYRTAKTRTKSRTVVVKTADEDLRWLQYHIFQKSEVTTAPNR